MNFRALLTLLRPALVPTAVADVLTAAVFFGGAPLLRLLGACGASASFYMGGMVLNDLADRERDAYLNPHRPLVQHPGLAPQAWGMVLVLFMAGLLLGVAANVAMQAAIVAALAIFYDLFAKKHFPADAMAMGACRAANFGMGISLAGVGWGNTEAITLLLGYGAYIGGLTGASRTEDFEQDSGRRKGVFLAALPMLVGIGAYSSVEPSAVFFLPGLVVVVLTLHALRAGTPVAAKQFVLYALLNIYVLHGALLLARGHFLTALLVIGLMAGSVYLMRMMKPKQAES
ncbi:MAG: UbiA family prenyltransferase [Planctomycetota bacterium]